MSLAIVNSRACIGIDAPLIQVETHLSGGLPSFTIVGLPEASVREARDRVRSALLNAGFNFPSQKITVNLAPADLPKQGGRYDLPMALGILLASGQIKVQNLDDYEFLGELALSAEIRPVHGTLAATLAARELGHELLLPTDNGSECAWIHDARLKTANHLLDVCAYLQGSGVLPVPEVPSRDEAVDGLDLQDVIGQQQAKRALMITAAGGHHLLMLGPPGTGKSMLAARLPGLLPDMDEEQARQSAVIHSVVGQPIAPSRWYQRPYRAPHHSASPIALAGGGSVPRPGEISLAHFGVLFLDELPEFERRALEILRQPLETGEITISRAASQLTFPARFQLIAAMNPSPSGHYRGAQRRDTPEQILRYLRKLSGPLLDRFDLSVEVGPLAPGALSNKQPQGLSSQEVRGLVVAARQRMQKRTGCPNAELSTRQIESECVLQREDAAFLEQAIRQLGLSVRAWHRILKVARTIADLDGMESIERPHLAEALGYRAMDRLLLEFTALS